MAEQNRIEFSVQSVGFRLTQAYNESGAEREMMLKHLEIPQAGPIFKDEVGQSLPLVNSSRVHLGLVEEYSKTSSAFKALSPAHRSARSAARTTGDLVPA